MDTKWKKFRGSIGLQVGAVILSCICFVALGIAMIRFNDVDIYKDDYFETYEFYREFSNLVYHVTSVVVEPKPEETIWEDTSEMSSTIVESSMEIIEAEEGVVEESIEEEVIYEVDVALQNERYLKIKGLLNDTVNFVYCIENSKTGEFYTNIEDENPIEFIMSQDNFVYYEDGYANGNNYHMYSYYGTDYLLSGSDYKVYAAILNPLNEGDLFYKGAEQYRLDKATFERAMVLLVGTFIIFLIAIIYLIISTGYSNKQESIRLRYVDKIYLEVYCFIVGGALYTLISILEEICYSIDLSKEFSGIILAIGGVFIGCFYLVCMEFGLSIIRRIRGKVLFKNTVVYQLFRFIKRGLMVLVSGKLFRPWMIIMLLAYAGINSFLLDIIFSIRVDVSVFFFFIWIAYNIAVIYYVAKWLKSLKSIMDGTSKIAGGDLEYSFDSENMSPSLTGLAEDIQGIQGGMKEAVNKALKGEHMKTSLITNVSHDLKTPLTSIITYVDLLEKEEIDNENARDYISVLSNKSSRLKGLIEDLIEASKASTGNLAVESEKINLSELISQACGEYEDKLKEAELQVIQNIDEESVLINGDGRHMWRILDNLLSNVIKYAFPRSRVYLDVYKDNNYGVITIKNISAMPLNISPNELTERFVRGDESRTTEGSGLGLSIAQSLTTLQNGNFNIEIDGDLFKVTVAMPLDFSNS